MQRSIAQRERARSFVLFQIIFWGAFLAMRTYASASARPEFLFAYMPNRVILVLAGAFATTLIHLALSRFSEHWRGYRFGVAIALCVLALFPMHALEMSQARAFGLDVRDVTFLDYAFQFGWALLMWAGYYIALEHAHDVRLKGIELAEAQERQHDAEIKMLRYQLNPHFLFNSLNAVSTLVLEKRNVEAEAMLIRLARFLRTTLDADPMQMSPLSNEFAMQRFYLEIEAVRFGDRLTSHFELPRALEDCVIPSMLLQPILENAIKHAVSHRASGGEISVRASVRNKNLRLVVEDNGAEKAIPTGGGMGIGIANTRERLARIYGETAQLTLERRTAGGMRVNIDLPMIRVPSND
jgi:signal transduction histidine kinase